MPLHLEKKPSPPGDYDWPCHPAAEDRGPEETYLIENRDSVYVLGYVTDAEADYSFHDYALVCLKDQYYLLVTSGCSCPSPTERWSVDIGPTTLPSIYERVKNGEVFSGKQQEEFFELIEHAEGCVEEVKKLQLKAATPKPKRFKKERAEDVFDVLDEDDLI
jgi:hypothetical protein